MTTNPIILVRFNVYVSMADKWVSDGELKNTVALQFGAFRTFIRFAFVLVLSVSSFLDGLRLVIVALSGLFSYLF